MQAPCPSDLSGCISSWPLQSGRQGIVDKGHRPIRQADIAAGIIGKLRLAVQNKDAGMAGHIRLIVHANITVHAILFLVFTVGGGSASTVCKDKLPPNLVNTGVDSDSGGLPDCQNPLRSHFQIP